VSITGKRTGRLAGRKALITDGDSGLGRDVSLAFAREGADLAIGYQGDDSDAAETTGALARAEGARVALLAGDLGDEGVCGDIVDRAAAHLGGLDIVVVIERVVRANLSTLRWLSQAALSHLRVGSAIIVTSPLAMSSVVEAAALQRMRRRGIRMRGVAPVFPTGQRPQITAVYVELAADPASPHPTLYWKEE
jgi:hypothetical protein